MTTLNSDTLIAKIERQNKRLTAIALVAALVIIAVLAVVVAQNLTVERQLQQQLSNDSAQVLANQQATKTTLAAIQAQHDRQDAHLRCIAQLFTQHPAGSITITDFDNCETVANQTTAPPPATATPTPSAPTKASAPAANTAPNQSNNGGGNGNGGNPNPSPLDPIVNAVKAVGKALGLTK